MQGAMLTAGIILGLGSAGMAMPLATVRAAPEALQVHGCHQYYSEDMSGWHRHDKECRTLRGAVGRKSRNVTKS